MRHTAQPCDGAGQQRRLVEAPREQPQRMQRHRKDKIGIIEKLRAGARHPAAENRSALEPVAIFEPRDQWPGQVVIGQRRAGSVIAGPAAEAGRAERVRTEIEGEGKAASRAMRGRQKMQPLPAFGAKCALAIDPRLAGEAGGRQEEVERLLAQRNPSLRRRLEH